MNRLKQHWKVVAYLVGFVLVAAMLPVSIGAWYVVGGVAWLFAANGLRRPVDKKADDKWPIDGYNRHYAVDPSHPRYPYSQS